MRDNLDAIEAFCAEPVPDQLVTSNLHISDKMNTKIKESYSDDEHWRKVLEVIKQFQISAIPHDATFHTSGAVRQRIWTVDHEDRIAAGCMTVRPLQLALFL